MNKNRIHLRHIFISILSTQDNINIINNSNTCERLDAKIKQNKKVAFALNMSHWMMLGTSFNIDKPRTAPDLKWLGL